MEELEVQTELVQIVVTACIRCFQTEKWPFCFSLELAFFFFFNLVRWTVFCILWKSVKALTILGIYGDEPLKMAAQSCHPVFLANNTDMIYALI